MSRATVVLLVIMFIVTAGIYWGSRRGWARHNRIVSGSVFAKARSIRPGAGGIPVLDTS